jgi:hypothetical protein
MNLLYRAISCAAAVMIGGSAAAAAPLQFSSDANTNSANIEALIPIKTFMNIPLPHAAVQFEDGMMAVTMVPDWNFDRVPVLEGPVIHTEVTARDSQAIVAGIVLFTQGYWYDRYWTPGSRETIVTTGGATLTGRISNLTATTITITAPDKTDTVVSLSQIKELHSPRAYAFAVPLRAAGAISPDGTWTADAQAVTISPTVAADAGPVLTGLRRDPLLVSHDGDWSDRKMILIGTAISLAEIAQFVPELVIPQISHGLWQHQNKKSFYNLTHPVPNPAPLLPNGNTYTIPIPGNATH